MQASDGPQETVFPCSDATVAVDHTVPSKYVELYNNIYFSEQTVFLVDCCLQS